jgi:FkbM family methyltransferase
MQEYGLVSIGSHTGFWLKEELKKFSSKKNILIEPVPYNIVELKENIKEFDNTIIEQSAISDKNELVSFYHIKRKSIGKLKKHWASGIGSFDKSHLLNHRNKRFLITDEDIKEIKINCISFDNLKKKYEIKSIDKLMLDVEGSEFKILDSIDLTKINIKQIFFEKKHFDGYMKQGEKYEKIKKKFEDCNYTLTDIDKENVLATLVK